MKTTYRQFAEHKEALIGSLCRSYESGPKTREFDASGAWRAITSWAAARHLTETVKPQLQTTDAVRDRAAELAEAMGKARGLLAAMLQPRGDGILAQTGSALVKEMTAPSARTAAVALLPQSAGAYADLRDMAARLSAIETAAERVAEKHRRGRGNSKGATLTPREVDELERIYTDATGQKATSTKTGRFVEFGALLCQALNIEMSERGISGALERRRARKARPKPGALPSTT